MASGHWMKTPSDCHQPTGFRSPCAIALKAWKKPTKSPAWTACAASTELQTSSTISCTPNTPSPSRLTRSRSSRLAAVLTIARVLGEPAETRFLAEGVVELMVCGNVLSGHIPTGGPAERLARLVA